MEGVAGHLDARNRLCDGQHNRIVNKKCEYAHIRRFAIKGNMIHDEDFCPREKRVRDIYLDCNPSISTYGKKLGGII